jgi:hypothetical protein
MERRVPLKRTALKPGGSLKRSRLSRSKRLSPVSVKRQAENRERRAMADLLWPDRREGTVMCGCGRPVCNRRADDLHETLSRARSGGVITDPSIWVPLSRECHEEITFRPESELGWAYDAGLLIHSWDAAGGEAA